MHLSGDSYATHVRSLSAMCGPLYEAGTNGGESSLPPIGRILLCPPKVRMIQGVINKSIRENNVVLCHKEDRFDARSAYIDAEKCLHILLLLPRLTPASVETKSISSSPQAMTSIVAVFKGAYLLFGQRMFVLSSNV